MSIWNEPVWFAFLVGAALKSTVVLGAAGLAAWLLRGSSSAARHLVWTAAAAAVLALPFLSVSLPKFGVPGADTVLPGPSSLVFQTTAATAGESLAGKSTASLATGARGPVSRSWRLDWPLLLMTLWAAGVTIALVQALAASIALARARRNARPFPDAQLVAELAESLGISDRIDVLETAEGAMPMTFGLWRSTVFMPAGAAQWTDERRRMVLLHELAHVSRGDAALHLMARAALSLYWWNPLAWMAWREFLKERERAADDLVLNAGARASDYAGHLLEVARTMRSAPAAAWASVAMARPSQLEGRLLAILDSKTNRKTPGRASAAAVAIAAVVLVAPFAAVQAQDRAEPTSAPDVAATIQAAVSEKNYDMLDKAAQAFEKLKKYDMAQQLLEPALTIRGQVSGEQSAEYAAGLAKLGDIERLRGKRAEAEASYMKAVSLGDRPEVASALLYLGMWAHDDATALNFLQRASYVAQSPQEVGRALTYSALVHQRQPGGAPEAESLFMRAMSVENGEYPMAAATKELYARFLDDQQREGEAKTLRDRAFEIRTPHLAEMTTPTVNSTPVMRASKAAGVTSPKLVSKVEPEYSEDARIAKLQGMVTVSVEIGTDGLAHNAKVVKSLGLGLDENAITAISQWNFEPGMQGGSPVTVSATIEVNFRLL